MFYEIGHALNVLITFVCPKKQNAFRLWPFRVSVFKLDCYIA